VESGRKKWKDIGRYIYIGGERDVNMQSETDRTRYIFIYICIRKQIERKRKR
jgi:hypothetical protein